MHLLLGLASLLTFKDFDRSLYFEDFGIFSSSYFKSNLLTKVTTQVIEYIYILGCTEKLEALNEIGKILFLFLFFTDSTAQCWRGR